MKKIFAQYYPLTSKQLESLWSNSIFIFDTNVMLNFYRYSSETSSEFLDILVQLKKRVWLPYQVGYEFHKNRISTLHEEIKIYNDFRKQFESICLDIENRNRNPFFSSELHKSFLNLHQELNTEIDLKIKDYEAKVLKDDILNSLQAVFDDNIGVQPTIDILSKIYKDGENRYKEAIPPGYEDRNKPIPDRYGDLIIWSEMLDHCKKNKKPLIFITDDSKNDWWYIVSGKTISARPELLKEFHELTGEHCHFYKPFEFLKYSNTYLGRQVKSDTISEVEKFESRKEDSVKYIIISVRIKSNNQNDFHRFISAITSDGYDVTLTTTDVPSEFIISVKMPNIPDLQRRFEQKYLEKINLFNIDVLSRGST